MARSSPGAAAQRLKLAAALLLAAAIGVLLTRGWGDRPAAVLPARPAAAAEVTVVAPVPLLAASSAGQAMTAEAAAPAVCALQSLQLALDQAPAFTVCLDNTQLQQNGSVRSYLLRAGDAQGWSLRVDMAERALLGVLLRARDGRAYSCAAPHCAGQVSVTAAPAGGDGQLSLRELRLAAAPRSGAASAGGAGVAALNASLRLPSDEQVPGLACTGPSISISAAHAAAAKFCGQAGAGVEIADNGQRRYRFQDHEGRTLLIAVDGGQRVVGVSWEGHGCRDDGCRGARTSSADPANDLAERSFFFGRTVLPDQAAAAGAGAALRPALVLDGSLVMPAQ